MGICGGGAAWMENSEQQLISSFKKQIGLISEFFFGLNKAVIACMSQPLRF